MPAFPTLLLGFGGLEGLGPGIGNFTSQPDFVVEEEKSFNTLVSQFENGAEQRRSKWHLPLRRFRLQFNNRSLAEYAAVRDMFDDAMGAYDIFTWVNPVDSVSYTVRFEADSFRSLLKAYEIYDFSFGFVEVR